MDVLYTRRRQLLKGEVVRVMAESRVNKCTIFTITISRFMAHLEALAQKHVTHSNWFQNRRIQQEPFPPQTEFL